MEQFLLVEKYRPKTVEECILPTNLRATFREFVSNQEIPNMILAGRAGIGKTTIARALCDEMGREYMFINGSEEGNIDTLRTKIKQFASTNAITGDKKVVILDEADYLNPQSTQPALRGFMEEYAANCQFILTCNFKHRIIEPLHSRCTVIDFAIPSAERPVIASHFFKRLKMILEREGIAYDVNAIKKLLMKHFPDFRKILVEVQRYSSSGKIDAGILVSVSDKSFEHLVAAMKEKDLKKARKWVVDNIDYDPTETMRWMYDNLGPEISNESVPALILILHEYMYKHSLVADPELNLVAMIVEIMQEVDFK